MNIGDVVRIAKRVSSAEGLTFGPNDSRDKQNEQWARIIGIVHHGHKDYNPTPDPKWCLKDAGGGRPQSNESVAIQATRESYDCIVGAGGKGWWFNENPHADILPMEQNIYPPPVPKGGGAGQPPGPGPTDNVWTAKHDAIRARMSGRQARDVAQQLAYSFPGEQWGEKRTSGGNWSTDTVGRLVDGRLYAVRLSPLTIWGFLDSSQHIHNPSQPVNHLGDAPVEPPVDPPVEPPVPPVDPPVDPPAPTPVDLQPVLDALEALRQENAADRDRLMTELASVKAQLKKGFKITLGGRNVGDVTPKE